jgi:hypothetical protein
MQKLMSMSVAAVLALAVMVPMASASGWRLERANSATAYTGPVTLSLSSGTQLKWKWTFPNGAIRYPICAKSTATGTITAAGTAPPYVPAGSLSSWKAWGFPGYAGSDSCTNGSGTFLGAFFTGTNVPWNMTVGTFATNQPKLAIQNPTVSVGAASHSTTLLEGKIVNPPNGTQTARVQFNDGNDAQGLNNTLTSASNGTLDLDAEYTLTGEVAGSPQNLKVVWVP